MKRLIISTGTILLTILVVAWLLPLPAKLTGESGFSTRILDRNGKLLYSVQKEGLKEYLPVDSMPDAAVSALTAVEDRSFYSNYGLSLRGMARALIHNLLAGRVVEGGSTITQQLVRTSLQPKKRGLVYKLREAWLALKITSRFTKEEIIERFLNSAYFGQHAYGLKAAARTYFDKNVADLSLGENALLIGLLNAPGSLNPFKNPSLARERRRVVLDAMKKAGSISAAQHAEAVSEEVRLSHGKVPISAPHFVFWLLDEYGEFIAGKKEVKTTLDLDLQEETERIVQNRLRKLKEKNVTSAAVVVLDAKKGDILAMIGTADYFDSEHDGAVNVTVSARQPGSAMKPFTYALAFTQGMTPATTVSDIETQFFTQDGNPYIPRNYDYGYHGLVRLREALANSYNIAAIKVLERIGVGKLLQFLRDAGISTLSEPAEHYGLALTLGDSEVKLLELARAYGVFARGGETLNLRALLYEPVSSGNRLLDPKVSWLVSDILSSDEARAAEFGMAGPLSFDFPVAAKTGTTRNSRDNWTLGYTPDRIVGVWVGNADNSPMRGTSGITGAGPIFHDAMIAATRDLTRSFFPRPTGIIDRVVCRISGKLPNGLCPATVLEYFISGTEPEDEDDIFQEISIDIRNGMRSGTTCDDKFVKKEIFAVFPPDLKKWALENGWKTPPADFSPLCPRRAQVTGQQNKWMSIARPHPGASFKLDPLIPLINQKITLEATADDSIKEIEWRVNGQKIGISNPPYFRQTMNPKPGKYLIEAVSGDQKDSVRIVVEK